MSLEIEKATIRRVIRAARADGMELDRVAFEGEWHDAERVTTEAEAVEAATACDMTQIRLADSNGDLIVTLALGEGEDCVADYNVNERNDRIIERAALVA